MNYDFIFKEEDVFPKIICKYEERPYGILFYNEEDKWSYDTNHALIYGKKITSIKSCLMDINRFYSEKGIVPRVYQSLEDNDFFEKISMDLLEQGYKSWYEKMDFMMLVGSNGINLENDIKVERVFEWKPEYTTEICKKSDEPGVEGIVKRMIDSRDTYFLVATLYDHPVGLMYAHRNGDVCRVDNILVAAGNRGNGIGSALLGNFVELCRNYNISNVYLWPDSESLERMSRKAGFRSVTVRNAGRATKL